MDKRWCGKPCSECTTPCALDESMPCSPDCEMLGENGEPKDLQACLGSGCDATRRTYEVTVVRDGTVTVLADSEFDAIYIVQNSIDPNEICWDDDYAITDAQVVSVPEE